MTELGEGFPIPASRLGSNRPMLEMLEANQDNLFEGIKSNNLTDLTREQRDQVYSMINNSFGSHEREFRNRARLHVATDAVKWVSERAFDAYPYRSMEGEASNIETNDRISTGLDLMKIITGNRQIENKDVLTDSLRLVFTLDQAMDHVKKTPSRKYEPLPLGATPLEPSEMHRHELLDRQSLLIAFQNCYISAKASFPDNVESIFESASEGRLIESMLHLAKQPSESSEITSIKQRLLDKAVDFTKGQPPEVFKERLELITKNIEDNLVDIFLLSPKHVQEVVDLHPANEHNGIWNAFTTSLAEYCTSKNQYVSDDMKLVSDISAAHRLAAPIECQEYLEKQVNMWFHPYFDEDQV